VLPPILLISVDRIKSSGYSRSLYLENKGNFLHAAQIKQVQTHTRYSIHSSGFQITLFEIFWILVVFLPLLDLI
jgi:hypothetical protein